MFIDVLEHNGWVLTLFQCLLWAKIGHTALNVVFWCNEMSFRYQKFTECLISKQLGYEVKLQIVTHISLHVAALMQKNHIFYIFLHGWFRGPSVTKSSFTFGIVLNLPSEIFWSEKWQSIAETLSNALHTFKIKLVLKIHRVYIKCAQGGKPMSILPSFCYRPH